MTTETRTTIEGKDVLAIEFECSKCHSRITVPIEKFAAPPIQCSVCPADDRKQWLIPGQEEYVRIVRFAESLRALSQPNANGNQSFRLRLQISGE